MMNYKIWVKWCLLTLFVYMPLQAQVLSEQAQKAMDKAEVLQLLGNYSEALTLLTGELNKDYEATDLAFFYAHRSGYLAMMDSLVASKTAADLGTKYADMANRAEAKTIALRAHAFLSLILDEPDQAMDFAQKGIEMLENVAGETQTLYSLHYIIYRIYSGWKNADKMEEYIRKCEQNARTLNNPNYLANAYNGLSSAFLNRYRKETLQADADSSMMYLKKAFDLYNQQPEKINANTFVITCVNIANHYLEYSTEPFAKRKEMAFYYLEFAEKELSKMKIGTNKWLNIYGIKSSFAMEENLILQAETYLLQGLIRIQDDPHPDRNAEYTLFSQLGEIASKKGDFKVAYEYQLKAERILRNIFNQRQQFNAQKLEIQYETQRKNQELLLLNQQKESERQQKFLYLGVAVASVIGLGAIFRAYHLRGRLEKEKEMTWALEKVEAETQMKFEKEEQARLKAEQNLLELQQEQLRKEVLASNLIIDRKNEVIKRIHTKMEEGSPNEVRNMIKEDGLISSDFAEVKSHINKLHPTFFKLLEKQSLQKLTHLDKKYCAYIYLNMNNKQIAQTLHVEAQTVRTFKYRLKQKFELDKDADLETFIQGLGIGS